VSSATASALELRGVVKSFGSVRALRGADFVLAPGEVHALLGENGAGNSTLLQVANGMITPEAGVLRLHGQPVAFRSPRSARAAGIGMVHQHFTSIPALTVQENIALAAGRFDVRLDGMVVGELLQGLDPRAPVESLGVALRQRLEIVKALATDARILLLDEPSAVLAPSEVDGLLALLRRFAKEGGAVVLVTHKLPEVLAAADRVTVLREGTTVLAGTVAEQTIERLAEAMIGGAGSLEAGRSSPKVPAARAHSGTPVTRLGDVTLHAGELIGIAAIEGNGQRELLRRIAGQQGGPVAFVPEDRTTEGLIPAFSLTENVVLGLRDDPRWALGHRLNWDAARAGTARLIGSFGIRAEGPEAPAATLSGGNQQKLILARALEGRPRILVAENPTRGLDIRATAEVHDRLREAARAGVTVIVYSTDLEEVLELGERILVVRRGQVLEAPGGADRRAVGDLMLGVQRDC
jgi:simple sugar transport system ATP-binding protein